MEISQISQRHYLANGKLVPWEGEMIKVEAPFRVNGRTVKLGEYPDLGRQEALHAVDSAAKAYDRGLGEWPQMSPQQRIDAVANFVSKILPKRDVIVKILMYETAKTSADAGKEFDRTIDYICDTISAYRELLRNESSAVQLTDGLKVYLDRAPLGVTLCMGPFNYPFNETMTSLIPALIMGNTAVMKPAKFGVLFYEPMLEAMSECFPPGVINVVYGDGAKVIKPIMQSGKVDVLAFIGSTRVANIVSSDHPEPHRLTKILGLGAHNYSIAMADTDIDKIMPELIKGSLSFNGQRCTTLALHFAHKDIADEYAKKLAFAVSGMKAGLPWEEGVQITHLVEGPDKIKYLQDLINDAVSKGARIMNPGGGRVIEHNLLTPAVLYPVTSQMEIFHKEQFGPVVPVAVYQEEDQVLRTLADSRYGQQISIFGSDKEKLGEIALKSRNLVGRVNINSQSQRGPDVLPFGGRKDSALGVLSIVDALKVFSLPSVITEK